MLQWRVFNMGHRPWLIDGLEWNLQGWQSDEENFIVHDRPVKILGTKEPIDCGDCLGHVIIESDNEKVFDKSMKMTDTFNGEVSELRDFSSIKSYLPQEVLPELKMTNLDLLHCFDMADIDDKNEHALDPTLQAIASDQLNRLRFSMRDDVSGLNETLMAIIKSLRNLHHLEMHVKVSSNTIKLLNSSLHKET